MRQQVYTSKCGNKTLRGTAAQLARKHEDLAVIALKEQRDLEAQQHSQYAEHWRKVARGQF